MNTHTTLEPLPKNLMTKFNSNIEGIKETRFFEEKSLDSMREPSTLKYCKSNAPQIHFDQTHSWKLADNSSSTRSLNKKLQLAAQSQLSKEKPTVASSKEQAEEQE